MGELIPFNINDFIEDFLKNVIEVDVLDYQKVGSGEEGYTIIYISNLNEDQSEILRSIGFEQIKSDLWIYYGFEIEVDKLRNSLAIKYLEKLQLDKWKELIYLRYEIDDIFYKKFNKSLFRNTYNTPRIILKWHGNLTLNESMFNDFIVDLNKLLIESIPKEGENICNSHFIRGVKCIRNAKNAHNSSKIRQLEYVEKYLNNLVGTSYLRRWYHFVKARICIIEDGIDFLNEVKSTEGEILDIFTNSQT